MATTAKNFSYEFTTDDDELNDGPTAEQGTMCNFYKLSLPANASLLSKQIAKSQAKRAERDERRRRRIDLSTVREQDENKLSTTSEDPSILSPPPPPPKSENDEPDGGGFLKTRSRSRIDSAPLEVKLKRQASLPEEERKAEPMDEEEARLVAMLLSGMNNPDLWEGMDRKMSLPVNLGSQQPIQTIRPNAMLPSPGVPKMKPEMKVSEWLLERSTTPDNLSIGTSVMLEDSGLIIHSNDEDDEEEIFFDAEEVKKEGEEVQKEKIEKDDVVMLEHDMQGLSLNRNMAMTQSLFKVEEEIVKDTGLDVNVRNARSTSVSPRPMEQPFSRNAPGSATFNVKHTSTLSRHHKFTPPTINSSNGNYGGNMTISQHQNTPLSSRSTARSVLRVHNINASSNGGGSTNQQISNPSNIRRGASIGLRKVEANEMTPSPQPPMVTINPSTPSRPPSVASSTGRSSQAAHKTSNLEGLQDLIHMQEEALRRKAFNGGGEHEQLERKMSWHSDMDANRQSTSTHSSIGSLSSSKSVDAPNALNRMGAKTPVSKIPAPRSRLPTPRGSNLPKRVHSVAAAVRFTTSKPQCTGSNDGGGGGTNGTTTRSDEADECF